MPNADIIDYYQGAISFTPKTRDDLRECYNLAVEQHATSFEFRGYTILTGYANYMLQHLDSVFGRHTH